MDRPTGLHYNIPQSIEQEIIELYLTGYYSLQTIADQFKISREKVTRILRKAGKEHRIRNRGEIIEAAAGEKHHKWGGGFYIDKKGYVQQRLSKGHKFAETMRGSTGYVAQHRLVMAEFLGRPLLRTETVHHIDGNKQNNDIKNLQLRSTYHGPGQCRVCLDCGSRNIISVPISDDISG